MTALWVERGDTFFTHSKSMLGRLIRWGETDPGETNGTWANHTGVVVESGWIGTPDFGANLDTIAAGLRTAQASPRQAVVVEALWHVRRGPIKLNGIEVRVFRPSPAYTEEEKLRLVTEADTYVGARYGWWKLFGLLGDRMIFRGKKVISKLFFIKSRPICSFLAAIANEAGRRIGTTVRLHTAAQATWPGFGMAPQSADPDEMMDFCLSHPEFWEEVK